MGTHFKPIPHHATPKVMKKAIFQFLVYASMLAFFSCEKLSKTSPDNSPILFDDHEAGDTPNATPFFSIGNCSWPACKIKWHLQAVNQTNLDGFEVESACEQSFAIWAAHTGLAFEQVLSSQMADIEINFEPVDGPGKKLGYTYYPCANYGSDAGNITLDSGRGMDNGYPVGQ